MSFWFDLKKNHRHLLIYLSEPKKEKSISFLKFKVWGAVWLVSRSPTGWWNRAQLFGIRNSKWIRGSKKQKVWILFFLLHLLFFFLLSSICVLGLIPFPALFIFWSIKPPPPFFLVCNFEFVVKLMHWNWMRMKIVFAWRRAMECVRSSLMESV